MQGHIQGASHVLHWICDKTRSKSPAPPEIGNWYCLVPTLDQHFQYYTTWSLILGLVPILEHDFVCSYYQSFVFLFITAFLKLDRNAALILMIEHHRFLVLSLTNIKRAFLSNFIACLYSDV